jgi:uncharacterized protein
LLKLLFNCSDHYRKYRPEKNPADGPKRHWDRRKTGEWIVARFEILDSNMAPLGEGALSSDMLFELGIMHSVGREVPVDLVAAHKWFNLAAMKGNVEAIRLRREIADQMSDREIAAAQRAARDWLGDSRRPTPQAMAA